MSKASDLSSFNADSASFKNRIINGDMRIDQRNSGASVSVGTGATYIIDRWQGYSNQASKFTAQRNAGSVTPPVGFTNYLGVTSLAATTVGTDLYRISQAVEGYNIADFVWGTASGKTVTLSFWVYSSLTGNFGVCLQNSANTRAYPILYNIPTANTWTYITITIPPETTGAWNSDNNLGVLIQWGLGIPASGTTTSGAWATGNYNGPTGAVNVVSTNGATFYITGVQLEKSSTASLFDYRPYTTELQLCQRYCQVYKGSDTVNPASNAYTRIGYGPCSSASAGIAQVKPLVTFRAVPTVTTSGSFALYDGVSIPTISAPTVDVASTPYSVLLAYGGATGLTATRAYELIINNSQTAYLWLTSEF
jgi:hypothetical protein